VEWLQCCWTGELVELRRHEQQEGCEGARDCVQEERRRRRARAEQQRRAVREGSGAVATVRGVMSVLWPAHEER
jgi:hypothetical protein